MKKVAVALLVCMALFATTCLHPVELVSEDTTELKCLVGLSTDLVGIMEMSGGYRCYVDEENYFWLSSDDCKTEQGDSMSVRWHLWGGHTLVRGGT